MHNASRLAILALVSTALGAPFVLGWGAAGCAVGLLAGIAAIRLAHADARAARRAAWAAIVGSSVALLIAFTLEFAAPNIVIAGQKAAGRQAVSTMRTVLWAQDQLIKTKGRAGLIGELSGAAGFDGGPPLSPPLLRPPFRTLAQTPRGQVADVGGYIFAMWVLTPSGPVTDTEPRPTIDAGHIDWLLYAWPSRPGETGYRSFCINRFEDIMELEAGGPSYAGLEQTPDWDACVTGADPAGRLADGVGRDGGTWKRWRGKQSRRSKAAETTGE